MKFRLSEVEALPISIHAPHTRSDPVAIRIAGIAFPISIHAPHTRSDPAEDRGRDAERRISIHAPHTRSDCRAAEAPCDAGYFNPRPSYEERRRQAWH